MAQLSSIISFPWSIKLIYGLMSDNVSIMCYKRKSYVIIMGMLQFMALFSLFIFELENEWIITLCLFLSSLSGAFLDVLVDALMVVQSRLDEQDGSEDL